MVGKILACQVANGQTATGCRAVAVDDLEEDAQQTLIFLTMKKFTINK